MEWTLSALTLFYLLVNVVYSLMGPFYPITALDKGVSPIFIGAAFSMMPAASFLASPFIGNSMDKISRRGALTLGLTLQAVAMVLLGVSPYFDRVWFIGLGLISRTLSGLSLALVTTACTLHPGFAMAASLYTEQLEATIALFEMMAGVGMMIGPVVAGLLYDYIGFQWIFFGMGVIFLSALPAALFIKEPERLDMQQEVEINVFTMCSYKEILLDAGAVVYVIVCLGVMETYVSTHLRSLGLSIPEIGAAFATDPACYTVCCYVYGKMLKTMNLRRVIQAGIALGVLSSLLLGPPYPLPASAFIVVLGMTVMGSAIASAYVPALPHMLAAADSLGFFIDDRLNDALSSVASGSFSLGEMLGPVVGGVLLQYMDFRNLVTVLAGVGVGYLLLHVLLYRRNVQFTFDMQHSITFYKHIHSSLFH